MGSVNTKRLWRQISEITNQTRRLEEVREARDRVDTRFAELREVEESLEGAIQALAHHPGTAAGVGVQLAGLAGLSWLLLAADVPIQWLLNAQVVSNVPGWLVFLASVAMAFGVAWLVRGAALAFLHDEDRPAASIRRCRWLAAFGFVMTLAAGALVLFLRTASPGTAGALENLAAASLWGLAEGMPFVGGVTLAWHHVLSQPLRVRRQLRRVAREREQLGQFRKRLAREEERLGDQYDEAVQLQASA